MGLPPIGGTTKESETFLPGDTAREEKGSLLYAVPPTNVVRVGLLSMAATHRRKRALPYRVSRADPTGDSLLKTAPPGNERSDNVQ